MIGLIVLTVLCGRVSAGSHSLRYFYTSMTPIPGLPEFVAVGYVDDAQFVQYDSDRKHMIPRQQWMAESMGPEYWERETQIVQGWEQNGKWNIQTIMTRTNQTGGLHTLQVMYGCELRVDGSTAGFYQCGWDGKDLIFFDMDHLVWVTPVTWGVVSKNKWDLDRARLQQVKVYLEQVCIEWLNKYLKVEERERRLVAPQVFPSVDKASGIKPTEFSCLVTGFYPRDIKVTLLRNDEPITDTESSGILPNHDGTYQLTRWAQIEFKDGAAYSCQYEQSSKAGVEIRDWGSHSLRYFYTSMTPMPGLPEFVAVGYLDDAQFVQYDSDRKHMIPRQQWTAESMGPDYWERETKAAQGWEQIGKDNIQTAMRRSNQTGGIHTLQVMYGCELRDDGSTAGFYQYGWDGKDFISFDKEHLVWVSPVTWGVVSKNKWDQNRAGNEQVKVYLKEVCIEWLKKYLMAGERERRPVVPRVFPSVNKASTIGPAELSCLVTGFYPRDIEVILLRNGQPITDTESTGILPNHDGTYQLTRCAQIELEDGATYSCQYKQSSKAGVVTIGADSEVKFTGTRICTCCVAERIHSEATRDSVSSFGFIDCHWLLSVFIVIYCFYH